MKETDKTLKFVEFVGLLRASAYVVKSESALAMSLWQEMVVDSGSRPPRTWMSKYYPLTNRPPGQRKAS